MNIVTTGSTAIAGRETERRTTAGKEEGKISRGLNTD